MSKRKATPPKGTPAEQQAIAAKRASTNRVFWTVTVPLIAIAGVALTALLVADMAQDGYAGSTPRTAADTGGSDIPGETPEAWFYDVANDRHWHEPPNHWHDGPPPPEEERLAGAASKYSNVSSSAADGPAIPTPTMPDGSPVEPYYYDEVNDQHWHAPHNHWHPGPPPPMEERTNTATPASPEPGPSEEPPAPENEAPQTTPPDAAAPSSLN